MELTLIAACHTRRKSLDFEKYRSNSLGSLMPLKFVSTFPSIVCLDSPISFYFFQILHPFSHTMISLTSLCSLPVSTCAHILRIHVCLSSRSDAGIRDNAEEQQSGRGRKGSGQAGGIKKIQEENQTSTQSRRQPTGSREAESHPAAWNTRTGRQGHVGASLNDYPTQSGTGAVNSSSRKGTWNPAWATPR